MLGAEVGKLSQRVSMRCSPGCMKSISSGSWSRAINAEDGESDEIKLWLEGIKDVREVKTHWVCDRV